MILPGETEAGTAGSSSSPTSFGTTLLMPLYAVRWSCYSGRLPPFNGTLFTPATVNGRGCLSCANTQEQDP
jgi:hypothetical protein